MTLQSSLLVFYPLPESRSFGWTLVLKKQRKIWNFLSCSFVLKSLAFMKNHPVKWKNRCFFARKSNGARAKHNNNCTITAACPRFLGSIPIKIHPDHLLGHCRIRITRPASVLRGVQLPAAHVSVTRQV